MVQLAPATIALGSLLVASLGALLALASQWGRRTAEAARQSEDLAALRLELREMRTELREAREEVRELATECRVYRASGGCPVVPAPMNGAGSLALKK